MARSGRVVEVPQVVGQFKIIPFGRKTPSPGFADWRLNLECVRPQKSLKILHLLLAVDDKILDVFDDEEESWGDTPYSDLKSKNSQRILDINSGQDGKTF
ncbi:unnamed protein product [Lepeophtheirus salmonis]|uniref:(salmon louse) hypothetical protein n=1 Tax=Lepeophtheirus salmonis TaxID=72036 RepID=A0A7R8H9N2_LEPSM|nr:unnamed protein product [Lepeophtheirus salmonis]CAF2952563.1 unnamed protein product [Lepeophtheirus salmonis]